ncbi:hypothetical protein R1flu_027133 [Riccia fluitans]|uniref:Uncharacterized protein n=1 Tax=Riccia fluitans TaxID=41844 RepID=A0ABD1XIG1_9MARC
MSRNIHLYHLRGKEQSMISMGLIGFKEGDTLLSLCQKLEDIRNSESAFQFWDSRLGSPIHTKLEALICVEDLECKVILFETKDLEESNLVLVGPRVKIEPSVIAIQPVERNLIYKEQNEGIVDVLIGSSEPSVIGDDRLEGKALFLWKRMSHATETTWWEARRDTLIGFCGDKDNHVCKMGLEVKVGSGESGYSKIVEIFEQKIQDSYAQVVIVNPLHEKLPRLIVYASVTCNLFTTSWVRDHWKGLKQRWDKCF